MNGLFLLKVNNFYRSSKCQGGSAGLHQYFIFISTESSDWKCIIGLGATVGNYISSKIQITWFIPMSKMSAIFFRKLFSLHNWRIIFVGLEICVWYPDPGLKKLLCVNHVKVKFCKKLLVFILFSLVNSRAQGVRVLQNVFKKYGKSIYEVLFSFFSVICISNLDLFKYWHFHVRQTVTWRIKVGSCFPHIESDFSIYFMKIILVL